MNFQRWACASIVCRAADPGKVRAAAQMIAGVTAILLASCATEPVPTGSRLVVTSPTAQFYKNGPAQEMSFSDPQLSSLRTLTKEEYGADGQLSKGAQVTLLKREIGFSRVMAENGAVGYVSNDQMQRAPAAAMARVSIPTSRPRDHLRSNEDTQRRSKPPRTQAPPEDKLDLLDLPLPLPG